MNGDLGEIFEHFAHKKTSVKAHLKLAIGKETVNKLRKKVGGDVSQNIRVKQVFTEYSPDSADLLRPRTVY